MVSIFFVISGFVLSHKALRQIRREEYSQLLSTLSSSTFRRAIRLYIPTLISVMAIGLLIQAGAFTWQVKYAKGPGLVIPGWREQDPPIISSFSRQMWDCFLAFCRMANPFQWKEYFITYDLHLWTIPVEFRCSIVVFLSLLGLARTKAWIRIFTLSFMSFACLLYLDRWDVCLFLAGAVLAELSLACQEKSISPSTKVLLPILLLGWYLACQPSHDPEHTPGYRTITALTPKQIAEKARFWPTVSAIIIVFALSQSDANSMFKRPFNSAFAQYLGKISYALYLVHGPTLRSLGFYTVVKLWGFVDTTKTTGGYLVGVMGGAVVVGIAVFWISDIFWRAVDVGCVKLARWFENVCMVKHEDEKGVSA